MHSSGLGHLQILLSEPLGVVIGDNENDLNFINAACTNNDFGQRFESWWLYNFSRGLVAVALHERILYH